ncbi:pimeloyl-ACP methyl ester carboxylesterase [Williamsia limnetica]|uniref:Pimeloyl-ACP methyl ester carboxylesterase n=1 Tax=Williamsia limnetica TaxID=882452 RepID=A0A318RYS1_WILLI|nr:alpha/beta hydrolase [Williamsia limnetica]PYE15504.1 pimeloyl-ACP methyl ester carboxylesterase [Williamsia limnetica]
MGRVELAAGTIEYREQGDRDGPPVVLTHGLLMNDHQWDLVLPLLPEGFRYLLPVLPLGGHRIPMKVGTDLTMRGMVALLSDFLSSLELQDATLVVSDWGGPLFLPELSNGQRISRLVICPAEAYGNFPPGFPGKVVKVATSLPGGILFALHQFRSRVLRRTPLVLGLMAKKPISDDMIRQWTDPGIASAGVRRDVLAYCRTKFSKPALIAATEKLRDFTGPALVIWAPETNVMRREHGEQLANLIPKGELADIDDAYVLIMLDQPQRTAELIGEFLLST